jgi:hypothetical protein
MQDAVDFIDLCADSVYGQNTQTWKYQLEGAHLATRTTTVGPPRHRPRPACGALSIRNYGILSG